MKFGMMFANVGPFATAEGAAAMASAAEASGFESLWAVEHVVVPQGYRSAYPYSRSGRMPAPETADMPDPLIWLTWVAARTRSIRLATGILILPQRNPVVTAKAVATLDVLSGGRLLLGVGVGWLAEEFEAIGVPFDQRGQRTDDHIAAMRALWTQDLPAHHGEFSSFEGAICRPRPAQGSVPVVIGGHTPAAARRAGRLGDGFFPARGDLPALLDEMRRAADEAGRDPGSIEVTWGGARVAGGGEGAVEEVGRLRDMGVDRVVIPPLALDTEGITDALGRFGDEVIATTNPS